MNFKAGDWVMTEKYGLGVIEHVTPVNSPYQVKHFPGRNVYESEELSKWQPTEGEWCWFWNSTESVQRILAKFDRQDTHVYQYIAKGGGRFSYCEPFIGELPSFLKESK